FDHYYHSKNASTSESSDVAADFYGHYKEDIALAAKIGLNVFRFSFSWSRIFPDGDTSQPANSMGVQHYHKVLDEMRNHNIEPMVTIFHFDYPQALEVKFGGWAGEEMIDVFVEYADFLFKEYGSKIKYWLTINEPELYCDTLAGGMLAPSTMTTPEKQNACLKNTILAHAKAHKIYEEKYKAKYKGLVGVGAGPRFYHGATNSEEDITAAENANVNTGIGLTIDPLVFGDYPEAVRDSRKAFTDEEKDLIKGRIDFVGVNINWGMVHVDFNSTGLERTLKNSWTFFKRVMKTRVVPLVEAGSQPFPDDDSTTTTSTTARTSSSVPLAGSAVLAIAAFLIAIFI
ncbi:hypothetical protein FOCC_FOCC007480, partial [Frankliniella occidentalis]